MMHGQKNIKLCKSMYPLNNEQVIF